MDLKHILGDIENAREALRNSVVANAQAAKDYSRRALNASDAVMEVAMAGGTCGEAYGPIHEVSVCSKLAADSLQAALELSGMYTSLCDTGDEQANDAYGKYLQEQVIEPSLVWAQIDGASTRFNMALTAMPDGGAQGSRFDPSVFSVEEEDE